MMINKHLLRYTFYFFRAFLGMTCHWITNGLEKKSAALACVRIRGSHTYDNIAAHIGEIHKRHGIEEKVRGVVTDNATNFAKAFRYVFNLQQKMTFLILVPIS